MRKVRYAIIGFSGFAENRIVREGFRGAGILPAIRGRDALDTEEQGQDALATGQPAGHPQAKLVGATGRTAARRDAATRLGLKWYDSVDALLDDPDVEAVFIATNNLSHAPLAERALQAGKHCLIEKPITTTLEDAAKLQQLARTQSLSLAVDHMMAENVYNLRARELIAQETIGQVNDISLHMEFCYGSTPQEAATWRCADPREIGGPIGDVGSHCLYMAEFLLGSEIASLACVYTPRTLDIAVENGAIIQFRTHSGVQGTARVAFNQSRGGVESTLTDLGYEVYGTQGILRGCGTLFQLSGHPREPVKVRLEIDNFKRTKTLRIDTVHNIYQAIIAGHARSILRKKPLDAADAVHNLKLVLACYRSADRHGRPVEF